MALNSYDADIEYLAPELQMEILNYRAIVTETNIRSNLFSSYLYQERISKMKLNISVNYS